MSFDSELRRALKPVDPGPDFTARVLAAVGQPDAQPRRAAGRAAGMRRIPRWAWPAVAASLVAVLAGEQWWQGRRELARGLEARSQVMQALRLTSTKLSVARDVVVERNYQSVP